MIPLVTYTLGVKAAKECNVLMDINYRSIINFRSGMRDVISF